MIVDCVSSVFSFAGQAVSSFRNATLENPEMSLQDPRTWDDILQGVESASGEKITHTSALKSGAVWQAADTISGDIATMTLNKFGRLENGDREEVFDDIGFLVSTQPNEEMSAFDMWRRCVLHACLYGAGYLYLDRSIRGAGRIQSMTNLLPDRTSPSRSRSGELFYITEVDGRLEPLFANEVFCLKGLSIGNETAVDLVDKARDDIGLAIAAVGFNSRFFANGAQAGGILELPVQMTKKAGDNLEEGFSRKYSGRENWFKTVILRDGAKFHQTMVDAEKSQVHELREDQVRSIARFFKLPPFKLGLADSVSYNSTEQAQLIYLTSTLNHWRSAIVGEASLKLLTDSERRSRTHFFEHNYTKLIEIDTKTMNEVLEIQRRNEIINANDWRRKINLPRRTDAGGDEYVNPNTRSNNQSSSSDGPASANQVSETQRNLFANAIGRIARRVSFDARKAAASPAKFLKWVDSRAHDHRPVFDEIFRVVADVIAATNGGDGASLCDSLGTKFFQSLISRMEPLTQLGVNDLSANVETACQSFESEIITELMQAVWPGDDHAEAA